MLRTKEEVAPPDSSPLPQFPIAICFITSEDLDTLARLLGSDKAAAPLISFQALYERIRSSSAASGDFSGFDVTLNGAPPGLEQTGKGPRRLFEILSQEPGQRVERERILTESGGTQDELELWFDQLQGLLGHWGLGNDLTKLDSHFLLTRRAAIALRNSAAMDSGRSEEQSDIFDLLLQRELHISRGSQVRLAVEFLRHAGSLRTSEQLADALGCTTGSVKVHIFHLRLALSGAGLSGAIRTIRGSVGRHVSGGYIFDKDKARALEARIQAELDRLRG